MVSWYFSTDSTTFFVIYTLIYYYYYYFLYTIQQTSVHIVPEFSINNTHSKTKTKPCIECRPTTKLCANERCPWNWRTTVRKICHTNFVARIVLKSERRDGISCTNEQPKSNRSKNYAQHVRKLQIRRLIRYLDCVYKITHLI